MPDAALEDLAVHQLCTFATRCKALVRLANVASAGGRKRNNDFAPLRNIFNEWLVRDTSKKIKAVKRSKGMSGKPITSKPVYLQAAVSSTCLARSWLLIIKTLKIDSPQKENPILPYIKSCRESLLGMT